MTQYDHDEFDDLIRQSMKARPAPQARPGIASRALARAKHQTSTRGALHHVVINALAAVVVIGLLGTILFMSRGESTSNGSVQTVSQTSSDEQNTSLSGAEVVFVVLAVITGAGFVLAIEWCLMLDRNSFPVVKFSRDAHVLAR